MKFCLLCISLFVALSSVASAEERRVLLERSESNTIAGEATEFVKIYSNGDVELEIKSFDGFDRITPLGALSQMSIDYVETRIEESEEIGVTLRRSGNGCPASSSVTVTMYKEVDDETKAIDIMKSASCVTTLSSDYYAKKLSNFIDSWAVLVD